VLEISRGGEWENLPLRHELVAKEGHARRRAGKNPTRDAVKLARNGKKLQEVQRRAPPFETRPGKKRKPLWEPERGRGTMRERKKHKLGEKI